MHYLFIFHFLFQVQGFVAMPAEGQASKSQSDVPQTEAISPENYPAEVATAWFEQYRFLIKLTRGYTPPVAARAFGYAGVALWESVVPGIPNGKSLVGQLTDLQSLPQIETGKTYHWGACANAALASLARELFPTAPVKDFAEIKNLEERFKQQFAQETSADVLARSEKFGQDIAIAIFEWSKTDGGHMKYKGSALTNYTPPKGTGLWVPTSLSAAKPLLPNWGKNRSFLPSSAVQSQPPSPIPFSTEKTSDFYKQAMEVYTTSKNLTKEQRNIAFYWNDEPSATATPSGHSISIAIQVLKMENVKLDKAAETLCKMGLAGADAFISCWKSKYEFNSMRPITYIRQEIEPNWEPMLTTPPFPEYTSGHSVQIAATAQVLSDLFGYNYRFTDRTNENRRDLDGTPRTYNSFFELAEEASMSRLYGGIHFRNALEEGNKQGKIIGKMVGALKWKE